MTWILVVLVLGTSPPQGLIILVDSERDCRIAEQIFCRDAARYRCRCDVVYTGYL